MRLKKIWLHFLSHFFPTLIGYQRVKWFSADGGGVIYIRVCRSFAAFSPLLVVVVHLLTVMITYQRITLDAHTLYRAISFFLFLSIGRFWCCSLASTGHFRALTLLVMSSNWHFCFAQETAASSAIKELRRCSRRVVYLFRAVTTGVLGCLHFSLFLSGQLSLCQLLPTPSRTCTLHMSFSGDGRCDMFDVFDITPRVQHCSSAAELWLVATEVVVVVVVGR